MYYSGRIDISGWNLKEANSTLKRFVAVPTVLTETNSPLLQLSLTTWHITGIEKAVHFPES